MTTEQSEKLVTFFNENPNGCYTSMLCLSEKFVLHLIFEIWSLVYSGKAKQLPWTSGRGLKFSFNYLTLFIVLFITFIVLFITCRSPKNIHKWVVFGNWWMFPYINSGAWHMSVHITRVYFLLRIWLNMFLNLLLKL